MNQNLKFATNIEEQITKLVERGMVIEDIEKAKENLLDIGYFRLGFYWFPFEKSYPRKQKRDHIFKDGTKIDYAILLYYFDFDLRNSFLRYISRVEINFRTKLIYMASNRYKEDPFWYVNSKYVEKSFLNSKAFQDAIRDANTETIVKQDLNRYSRSHAPAWKVLEYLSFGVVISLFDNLKDGGLKHAISMEYGMGSSTQFSNYMNTIRRLRNFCAHGKVLYDTNLPVAISNGPAGDLGSRKTMLSGAYYILKYILGKVSTNRQHDLVDDMRRAFDNVEFEIVKKIICDNSGFDINTL
ncbi:Abi family protein [Leyella stercorea]|uniref:Abi family protein n=2 Tax=Prevotellaceae TaxID=171552 RepID=UPI00243123D6|nr:Abi family protein [Leyella stercorea]